MAQAANTPPKVNYVSSISPLPPYAGPGPVRRDFIVASTGSAFSISTSTNSLSGMTGLLNISAVSICSTSAYIYTSNASSNGDGTLGASAGPWIISQSDTRPCDWAVSTLSVT